MRGVTNIAICPARNGTISTHTPHARRDGLQWVQGEAGAISTHTPHARRDGTAQGSRGLLRAISTHTPHARRDPPYISSVLWRSRFLLTRLMRGVTESETATSLGETFLLTRLMRGVTLIEEKEILFPTISTHTPHARRDAADPDIPQSLRLFLLTRLMRGVTLYPRSEEYLPIISTHTPHARRDFKDNIISIGTVISTHTPHARRDVTTTSR